MNITRFAVLGVAAVAAGAAALLVRGAINGGKATVQKPAAPLVATVDVLVASKEIVPGHVLDAGSVRWQAWPKGAAPASVIIKTAQPDIGKAIDGMVTRAPLIAGQPITDASIVHTHAIGFMAATIMPGMRGISVPVTQDTGVGGFILPNDRVDVVLTRDLSAGAGAKNIQSQTVLTDVRVLAIDQVAHQEKDQQTVLGKTATLELAPKQAELLAQAEQIARTDNTGGLSLLLRSLGDSNGAPMEYPLRQRPVAGNRRAPAVTVFRYGVVRPPGAGENAPGPATNTTPESDIPTTPNPDTASQGPVALETPR